MVDNIPAVDATEDRDGGSGATGVRYEHMASQYLLRRL
jgi:hypothetical protein